MQYEWDEHKRLRTLRDRNLDFKDADILFRGFHIERDASRYGEWRSLATGVVQGRYITVLYTWRGKTCRIIMIRRAWPKERRAYDRARAYYDAG